MPITAVSRETPPASPPLHAATYEEALATGGMDINAQLVTMDSVHDSEAEPGDTIATTKEEEWVTRKKSEVTTTRQIATRVKRELILEDGRILKDSGPKISTSVNEDTHTTNYQQTEHRVPDEQIDEEAEENEAGGAIGAPPDEVDGPLIGGVVAPAGATVHVTSLVVANPDGKVRESHDKRVLTRNITERVQETEERIHKGDTTHDTAGVHPSQSVSRGGSRCGTSTKSSGSSAITASTDSAQTEEISEAELSLFDHNLENLDLCVRTAEDAANVENFNPATERNIIVTRHKNPIWMLLNKGSLEEKRIANLPEDCVLDACQIKVVAQSVAQYLFLEATLPKRQVTPSICTFWTKSYFEALFPCTSAHRFYFIKIEEYKTKSGKHVNKTRPIGALYTQLSLLRKKLLEKDSSAKLRTNRTSLPTPQSTPQKVTRASCHRPAEGITDYCPPESDLNVKTQLTNLRTLVPSHTSSDLLQDWVDTHDFRMKELKETPGLAVPSVGPALALIAAVNETPEEDIRDALKSQTEHQLALVPHGPKLVKDTTAYNTTITTDDTEELRALRPDGTIVTETRHTKEQERLCDEELSKDEVKSLPSDKSVVEETGGTERRKRVVLEQSTDLMAGGLRVATHINSRSRTEEVEREGQPNMDDDWDSLSVRMRRQRRLRQVEQDKDYKRPVDYDIEEETRKKETSKWLENHFGSESRSSHDSIAEEIGRRPDPTFYKKAEDEGYYGKTSSVPPPPVYGDRVLRKTKSSTPSDERPTAPVNRTGGYFKGVGDWSQRRASKPRMPEPRSSSPSPPTVRSPYASDDRLNGSSPRHAYGKRDSPQGRSSPIGRRHPPSRDDSAYVSSSTMHSPPRGSPFRPLEAERSFREPSVEDDYRPVAPERKRPTKQRSSEEHRYDSGYRSSSRNENSGRSRDSREEGAVEPPPDYSPPRERRESSDRDRTPPRRRDRDERKQNQKTRFADNGRRPSPARKSVGSAIGNSIRKLVGKIRSASAERRAKWRNSRTPSPEHSSRTYKQYGGELAPPVAPPHRYYLGEDPFAPSIYGREHKYEGSSRRAAAADARDHRERGQFSSTLGRFSHSTSRLNPNIEPDEEHTRSAQTLPRKLHDRKEKTTEPQKPSSNKYWHRLTPNKRSNSAVNISNNVTSAPDGKINGYPPGPAKPARTYKALNRSKSFAMGAPEQETHPRYVSTMNRNYSTMYKSNPHLSRLDETPEQLKSPGIVSIINRSQRDLADAVSRETERRRDGLFGARYGKTTPVTNGHTNGYSKSYDETDKKKIFLKGLRERAPELYQTLHADDESDGSRLSSRYNTPSPHYKDRISEERKTPLYKTESLNRETSPFVSRLDSRIKSPAIRRGSNSSDNYSETYRYTTRSGDPERPSVTDTVETVSKKIVPSRDGRSKEIIESREINSVTKSRGYKGEPIASPKYIENGIRPAPHGYESKNGPLYSERRSSNYKVIEKIRDY